VRLNEGTDSLDQLAVSLRIVEPVQDRHSNILNIEPRRKPLGLRLTGGRAERLLSQIALGERLWIVVGPVFCFAAQDVQVSPLEGVVDDRQALSIDSGGRVVAAQTHQDNTQAFADGTVCLWPTAVI
jgi:hypothetical protein